VRFENTASVGMGRHQDKKREIPPFRARQDNAILRRLARQDDGTILHSPPMVTPQFCGVIFPTCLIPRIWGTKARSFPWWRFVCSPKAAGKADLALGLENVQVFHFPKNGVGHPAHW
jgi:hypothetical protein